jgi:acid phosphatase
VSVPRPAHIVVVVLENHAAGQVIGNSYAPFINALARSGALFTRSFAITHPSQPNYLALFSGSTQGLTSDSCPHTFHTANLGSRLRAAGRTFAGYSEGLPSVGYLGCSYGSYARKHAPWTDFPALPAKVNRPFTAFPHTYAKLPSLSFVIPNLDHDMHDGTIAAADTWLHDNLRGYVRWAKRHHSLFVLTWDEDDNGPHNQIATVIAGARVKHGRYTERVTHYRVLRTLEWLERIRPIGASAKVQPLTNIWTR